MVTRYPLLLTVVSSSAVFNICLCGVLLYYLIFPQPQSCYWTPWIAISFLNKGATQHIDEVPVKCLAFGLGTERTRMAVEPVPSLAQRLIRTVSLSRSWVAVASAKEGA